MKKLGKNIGVILLVAIINISCAEEELPKGFEVVWNKANIYFVYLHKNMRGNKTAQRKASMQLCQKEEEESRECEVYMWSNRGRIPDGLPIRNAGSFAHSYFKLQSDGKKKYKCHEC